MRVTQEMVERQPAAKYLCPSCFVHRSAATMVWSGTVQRYVCRQCEPDGGPTLADVQLWRGRIR